MNLPRFVQYKLIINLFMLCSIFCAGLQNTNAQEININFEKFSPLKAFQKIELSTSYRFIYNKSLDLSYPLITLTKNNSSIDVILKEIELRTGLVFQRDGNNIAVKEGKRLTSNINDGEGRLSGKIVDDLGTELFDVVIQIFPGKRYAITDNNGDFSIKLPVGIYNLKISILGFNTYRLEEVIIKKNETTPLNISMTPSVNSLEEVVITSTYNPETSSTEGLLLQQKKAAQFSDGISAEQISKTPDNNVGSTLKRITGVTTVEDQYVVVRSMGDRWNQAVMDGINLPSTDAFRQRFSFDIIPTILVESVVVSKTATPDMFSSFAGGQVEVKTKDIPKENFTNIILQTSYNDRSTFKDRITKQQGKYDYFGFDDGTRDFPELVPIPVPPSANGGDQVAAAAAAAPFLEQSRKFTQDNFTNFIDNTNPESTYQLALGRQYKLNNTTKWGFVASASLHHTERTKRIGHTGRGLFETNVLFIPATASDDSNTKEGDPGFTKFNQFEKSGFTNSGASYNYNTTLAGMLNGGVQFGKHRISLRNTYSHIYNNELTQITGWRFGFAPSNIVSGQQPPSTFTTSYPVFQNFLQNKLEGSHRFGQLKFNWFAAHTYSSRDTKDATDTQSFLKKRGDDLLTFYQIARLQTSRFSRSNFHNKQTDYNWGANLSWKFEIGNLRNVLKGGYFGNSQVAENQRLQADLRIAGNEARRDIFPPFSRILDPSNYTWGGHGWLVREFYDGVFKGEVAIHSPFAMVDTRFNDWIRLVGGLRAEYFTYTQVSTQRDPRVPGGKVADSEKLNDEKWQYLPSVSLIFSPKKNTNIRLGYNKSVLRPKFAERLEIPYFDPVLNASVVSGPSGLISSVADNYDFKLEWFPSLGEIISFGLYYKNIQNPIEQAGVTGSDRARFIFNINSDRAVLKGLEMEFRKNLSFLGERETLKRLFLSGNLAINETKVRVFETRARKADDRTFEIDRPLFGQSPYAFNVGIDYSDDRLGFGIFHSGSGDQFLVTGLDFRQEEIRLPYSTTDAQIRWRFLTDKNLEIRCNFQNIFDSVYRTYNNVNSYRRGFSSDPDINNSRVRSELILGATDGFDEGIDEIVFESHIGRTFSLAIQYSF